MPAMTMSKVLSVARQLPAESQLLLVKELLIGLQKETPFEFKKINDGTKMLEGLSGLTDNELHALADAMIPAEKQQRLTRLLRKNSSGAITGKETEELDALLVLCQQISLLKAKAILTLQQRGAHEK